MSTHSGRSPTGFDPSSTKNPASDSRQITAPWHAAESDASRGLRPQCGRVGRIGRRILELNTEITELDKHLARLVASIAPTTLALPGVGVETAAQLLITTGPNIDRFRGEASFAALCAASPIPASSGKTSRYRLNPGGDRAANNALYIIALVRMRYCPRTQAYIERRLSDGLSKREAIRAVKRYIARDLYHALVTDLTRTP